MFVLLRKTSQGEVPSRCAVTKRLHTLSTTTRSILPLLKPRAGKPRLQTPLPIPKTMQV